MSGRDPGDEPMCDECPDFSFNLTGEEVPCRFWLKDQPCPGPEGLHA